jgi:teichuronic acid biosynthesis protein TuaE
MDRRLSNTSRTALLLFTVVFLGGLLGAAAFLQPMLILILVFGTIAGLLALTRQDAVSYGIVLSAAISYQYLIQLSIGGLDLLSFYKLVILMLVIPAMLYYGIRLRFSLPIVALGLMVIISYLLSDWHESLSSSGPIKAFIGLAIPFVFLMMKWRPKAAVKQIEMFCYLPLISVITGALLHGAGIHPFYVIEFTGAFRVQAANIPPHLAMLGFIGFLIAMIEVKRNPKRMMYFYGLAGINFAILLSTGTRGPLLAAIPLILYYVFDLIKGYLRGKVMLIIPLMIFFIVAIAAGYLQLDNLKKRSLDGVETNGSVDLSGRAEAWDFFLKGASSNPMFGRGLGSSIVANDGSIYEGFVVPHNEYIRFYYDGGIVGAVLFFGSLLIVFIMVLRRMTKGLRPYVAALIIGFLIYSFSDNTLSTIQLTLPFFWFLNVLYSLESIEKNGKVGKPYERQVSLGQQSISWDKSAGHGHCADL